MLDHKLEPRSPVWRESSLPLLRQGPTHQRARVGCHCHDGDVCIQNTFMLTVKGPGRRASPGLWDVVLAQFIATYFELEFPSIA